MTENETPQEKLIEKFKDEPFSIIDERGTILNKTHLSSMGYATHVPYSVVGLSDLLTSINKLAHEKDELEKENEQLKKENKQLKIDLLGQSEEIEILSDENTRLKQSKYIYGIHGGSNDK